MNFLYQKKLRAHDKFVIVAFLSLVVFLTSAGACALASDDDWPLYGREHNNQRFSPHADINTENVSGLKLVWKYHTDKKSTFQSSPIVKGDVMFVTTPFNDVVALNAVSGKALWRYQHTLKSDKYCCGPANRGPAVADGKVYTVTIDGRLIALDQNTGAVVWDKQITSDRREGILWRCANRTNRL